MGVVRLLHNTQHADVPEIVRYLGVLLQPVMHFLASCCKHLPARESQPDVRIIQIKFVLHTGHLGFYLFPGSVMHSGGGGMLCATD